MLALLVALATATVLAAAAGARRGQTAFDRLWASTLPATVTVLPNQPGFDWDKVRALPEVAVLTEFPVNGTPFVLTCCPDASVGFAPIGDEMARTIERPVLLAGRLFDPGRADEILVTPQFAAVYHKGVGDLVTMRLASPKQVDEGWDGTTGPPRGPVIRARIVGVGRNVFGSATADGPGPKGGVLASPALFDRYRANILGTNGQIYINALIRLKGGAAAIPAFRADLARVTGRSDIDVWNNREYFGGAHRADHPVRGRLPARLRAGRAGGRAVPGRPVRGQVHLGDRGRPPGPAGGGHDAAPGRRVGHRAAAAGRGGRGHARRRGGHRGLALDADRLRVVPRAAPGHRRRLADPRPRLGPGAASWWRPDRPPPRPWRSPPAGGRPSPRRSAVAAAAAAAGLGVPVVVGARFALEPGRGRAAVPVRPALLGAVAGVLGVLAAFTFSAGVSDAAANPARFGQTWQLDTFLGLSGQDFGPAAPGPAGGGRRPGRHRGRRRADRRRPVRPGLGGELHL